MFWGVSRFRLVARRECAPLGTEAQARSAVQSRRRRTSAAARRLIVGALLPAAATLAAAASSAQAASPDHDGAWGPVIDFGVPATHMMLLHNGLVLYWRAGHDARLWNPATGAIAPVPNQMAGTTNAHCAGHVILPDGRVMVSGGELHGPHTGIRAISVFDPATNTWTTGAETLFPRWYPTLTVLGDGRVLVANGEDETGVDVPQFEVSDDRFASWTLLDRATRHQDIYAFNALLPDGRVVEASPRSQAQVLDMSTGEWTGGPVSGWRTIPFTESDAIYEPGKIIRAGGTTIPDLVPSGATNRSMTVDMTAASPAWQENEPMHFARRRANLVLLADGQVLVEGGTGAADDPAQAVLPAEIWNPSTRQWTTVASMSVPRMYHSAAVLLPDGRVLTGGGEPSTAGNVTPSTAQVYSPPYLFKGPRPEIASAPTGVPFGSSFFVGTPDAAGISSVALIRPGATTHSINMDQRYVPLPFSADAGGLAVTAPANGNVAPPGYYFLVIENSSGVPSVAAWVQIGTTSPLGNGVPAARAEDGLHGALTPAPAPAPAPALAPAPAPALAPAVARVAPTKPSSRTVRLRVGNRISRRTLARSGLTITLVLPSRPGVVRIRLAQILGANRKRLLVTAYRVPRRRGVMRVTLRSQAVRTLRSGRYDLSVAVGPDRRQLGAPLIRRLTVVGERDRHSRGVRATGHAGAVSRRGT